jgi:hypothetical protein
MAEVTRPEGWAETVDDLIRAKFNYDNTNSGLKKKYGDEGAISGDEYRKRKTLLTGGDKVDEKLDDLGARKQASKKKPLPAWSSGKQKAADGSKLAQIVNMGIFQGMLPFCENKELKEEHVQEINPGGAIVANINYYFPEQKLDHPLVLLGIRVVILYIKFKSICGGIRKGKAPQQPTGQQMGLKPGLKTDMRSR